MALPLKSGADLYNNQALRLRLHNLGADPTEVGAGLIYFNTSTGLNTSQKARLYTGSAWKTIAFSEDLDVASNADFLALKNKVDAFLDGGVDADNVLENLAEVQKFLDNYSGATSLSQILDTKLDKTGGTIEGNYDALTIKRNSSYASLIRYANADGVMGYLGFSNENTPAWYPSDLTTSYALLHSGNVGDYNAGSATKLQTARTIWGQSFDGTGDVWGNLNLHSDKLIFNSDAVNYFISCQGTTLATYNMYGGHSFCTEGGAQRMLINSSGNVIIGPSSSEQGRLKIVGADDATDIFYASDYTGNALFNIKGNGNVLIGTTTDDGSGAKLQVNGKAKFISDADSLKLYTRINGAGIQVGRTTAAYTGGYNCGLTIGEDNTNLAFIAGAYNEGVGSDGIIFHYGGTSQSNGAITIMGIGGNVGIGTSHPTEKLHVVGNLHVKGNIIADGEVSAGGAAEEGGNAGSGAGAFHSDTIKVDTTQKTITHGLGTDDIVVSIYEKDGVSGRWSLILTDVEIVDANNIIVSFGSATSVEHKVVIMGAVA